MNALRRGDTTTKDNLNVFIYDKAGALKDPYSISFDLFDSTSGSDVLIGGADRPPIKFAIGSYFAPWQIPDDESLGIHKIVWKIRETATSDIVSSVEQFEIVSRLTVMSEEYPESVKRLIHKLRVKLRDINPDRDYHFAPPSSEQEIAGFTETRGYKWADEQLVNHLEDATNYVNLWPPATDYTLTTYPSAWEPLMLLEAQVYALYDLAILWAAEEFNYSLAGVSLDIRRSDKYSGIANQMQSMVDKRLEMAKKRIKCIVGLRQDRYTYSRGAALGPWCTHACSIVYNINDNSEEKITIEDAYNKKIKYSYSMDEKTGILFKNKVKAIWSNGIQELYTLSVDNKNIRCTNTHRFFDENFENIQLKDLICGQKIWIKNDNILTLSAIKDIQYFGKHNTYDLEMCGDNRNYIADDIVVHNTSGQNIKRWTGSRFNRITIG